MIGHSLAEQQDRAWEMLRATVPKFEPGDWATGPSPDRVPARIALHIVAAVDYYSRPKKDGFDWSVWKDDDEHLPDRKGLIEALEQVAARCHAWLESLSDEAMAESTDFEHTGSTVLEQNLYQLRHTMAHIGELSMALRAKGFSESEWR
jgi:hypothetical protein